MRLLIKLLLLLHTTFPKVLLCLPFIIVVVVLSLTEAGVVLVTVAKFVVISFAVFDVDAIVIVEDVPL